MDWARNDSDWQREIAWIKKNGYYAPPVKAKHALWCGKIQNLKNSPLLPQMQTADFSGCSKITYNRYQRA